MAKAPKPADAAPVLPVPAGPEPEVIPPSPAATEGLAEAGVAPPEPALLISGPKAGRRRIGREFGAEPVRIALADLTGADLEALQADPALILLAVDLPG